LTYADVGAGVLVGEQEPDLARHLDACVSTGKPLPLPTMRASEVSAVRHHEPQRGADEEAGLGGMEFTWRMVSTLAWPIVAVIVALVYRKWITEKVRKIGVKAGPVDVEVTLLDEKVDAVGQDISATLADNMPQPEPGDAIPQSLVDLIPAVTKDRAEGVRIAFDLVHRALKEHYPALRRVLPQQLPEAMRRLVEQGAMEADLAMSVQQLYELLVMPEWEHDEARETRGYAFLMLAEGAIHGILRSAQVRAESDAGSGPTIPLAWTGRYNDAYPIRLAVTGLFGSGFSGVMTYPSESGDDTQTKVTGTIEADGDRTRLTWRENDYIQRGSRSIDFDGEYMAFVRRDELSGAWYSGERRIADFTMTASPVPLPPEMP
jgi:hypothetical protein